MTTQCSFNEKELKLLLITMLKLRCICFDCIRFDVDPQSLNDDETKNSWVGKRAKFPLLPEIEKCLALLRLHINSEETVRLYEAMGFFDGDNNETFFK